MTTSTTDERIALANTICSQIPRWLKMAVGFQHPVATEKGVRFQVRGRFVMLVDVDYDEASDLYNVTVRTKRKPSFTIRHQAEQVDVEQMIDIIDRIDRGLI